MICCLMQGIEELYTLIGNAGRVMELIITVTREDHVKSELINNKVTSAEPFEVPAGFGDSPSCMRLYMSISGKPIVKFHISRCMQS